MKISLAQIRSEKGVIVRNVELHLAVLQQIELGGGDLVVFPELSLSNYDLGIAAVAAMDVNDERLEPFQRFVGESGTTVAVGAPLKSADKGRGMTGRAVARDDTCRPPHSSSFRIESSAPISDAR